MWDGVDVDDGAERLYKTEYNYLQNIHYTDQHYRTTYYLVSTFVCAYKIVKKTCTPHPYI